MEQMSQEAQFNTVSYLLLQFMVFTFILNTALGSRMLVQKGMVCISAKEIPLCPMEVQGTTGTVDEGVKTEQFLQDTERISSIRCFPVCAWKMQ